MRPLRLEVELQTDSGYRRIGCVLSGALTPYGCRVHILWSSPYRRVNAAAARVRIIWRKISIRDACARSRVRAPYGNWVPRAHPVELSLYTGVVNKLMTGPRS